MDLTDIGKVASRKRMNTDAEKLREKVSRETAKIIKLKVAQDTAYWDLKERLQQLQGAHERLQQNMVDVQMQHEAASAHYTSELRLRPDTLNKLAGTRGLCDVLEEYGERLRRCVARCRSDRAALQAAYAQCGTRVRLLAADLTRSRALRASQRDSARRDAARQSVEARQMADALEQLGAARARADERATARDLLAARLRQADEAAAAMRDEMSRLMQQFNVQAAEMRETIARQEDEARVEGERLRREAAVLGDELRRALDELADAKNTIDHMKQEEATHVDHIKNLGEVINDKNQHAQDMEAEIRSIKEYVCKLEAEKLEVSEHLNKSVQECNAQRSALDELTGAADRLRDHLTDTQSAFHAQREADAKKIEELSSSAAAKDRELDANTGTIARLMTDLKSESDARARADASLAAARRHADAERDLARNTEQQLRDAAARLDLAVKAKDDELSAQMTIILDMRSEKERLQERIQGMQNTIDNIQKELTGRLAVPKGASDVSEPPELDAGSRKVEPHKAEPRRADDSTLYNFLSDGSVDGDALDPREVGRRFEALARGDVRGVRPRAVQGSISLSQVKDDLKLKSRTFFKNKRFDSKTKKFK